MKDLTIRKKFAQVSSAGLGIAKNGKLQFPLKLQLKLYDKAADFNCYGQPRPKVGDFCSYALPSGVLTAGTVGKIIAEDPADTTHDGSYKVQFLDGRVDTCWRYGTGLMTEPQAKEVRDYYVETEKRPERIKRDFWPK